MTWTLSCTGQVLDLRDHMGTAGRLSMFEIAHSLANINRYTGHAVRPISVAEHSLLVCDIVEQQLGGSVHAQLAALMHDAHECMTNDMATPVKHMLAAHWHDFERAWAHAFAKAFGLCEAMATYGAHIHHADLVALATERRDLMHPGGPAWPSLAGVHPMKHVNLRNRDAFTWQDWRGAFVDRYDELLFAVRNSTTGAHA